MASGATESEVQRRDVSRLPSVDAVDAGAHLSGRLRDAVRDLPRRVVRSMYEAPVTLPTSVGVGG